MHRLIVAAVAGMFCFSGRALADTQRVGDWAVDIARSYTEAYTANNSGSMFGFLCLDGTCSFYLDTGTRCNENSKIPMLINSDSGSTFVISSCIHFPGDGKIRYVSSIQDKDIVTAISSGVSTVTVLDGVLC